MLYSYLERGTPQIFKNLIKYNSLKNQHYITYANFYETYINHINFVDKRKYLKSDYVTKSKYSSASIHKNES